MNMPMNPIAPPPTKCSIDKSGPKLFGKPSPFGAAPPKQLSTPFSISNPADRCIFRIIQLEYSYIIGCRMCVCSVTLTRDVAVF